MDALLDAQRRALGAALAAAAGQPGLHRHLSLALQRELALASACADIRSYQRCSGGAFEPIRAAWLDRIAARLRLAVALADPLAAQAALVEACAVVDAPAGIGGWASRVVDAAQRAAPWAARAAQAGTQWSNLVHDLLLQHTRLPPESDHAGDALGAWQLLLQADPAALALSHSHGAWPTRYAQRLPWLPGPPLSTWLAALPHMPVEEPLQLDADPLASLDALTQRWQRQWATDGADPGPPWDGGPARHDAMSRHLPPAEAQLRRVAALELRQARWPQPLLAAHAAALRGALAGAATDSEVECLAGHAEACLAIEADWQTLLATAAAAPLRAALMVACWGETAVPGLQRAVGVAHGLLGLGPRALLDLPLLRECLLERCLPAMSDPEEPAGAYHGETGHDLLAPLRGWLSLRAATARPVAADAVALRRALLELFDEVGAAEPPPHPVTLLRWGRPLPLDRAHEWPGPARRPPLPGWQPQAVGGNTL